MIVGMLFVGSAGAQAQDGGLLDCDPPTVRRPEEVTPAVGAREVSVDAPLRLRYSEGYFAPGGPGLQPTRLLTVQRCATDACDPLACSETSGAPVPGRVQVLGDELVFLPTGGWAPGLTYSGIARGVDEDLSFRFCTGAQRDTRPPVIGVLGDVTSTPVDPRCGAEEGGFRVATFFSPAVDPDGPPGSLEYLLYQTRGPGIEGPVLRDRVRNFGATDTVTMAFVLSPEEAISPICVGVVAVDGAGNYAEATVTQQNCVDPVQGNFFYPLCSLSSAGVGLSDAEHSAYYWFPVLGLIAFARRRRRS